MYVKKLCLENEFIVCETNVSFYVYFKLDVALKIVVKAHSSYGFAMSWSAFRTPRGTHRARSCLSPVNSLSIPERGKHSLPQAALELVLLVISL
jgi:hypothetical protein